MLKKWFAAVLALAMLVMPLTGMTLVTVSAASDGTYAVDALSFEAGYASTQDGTIDLSTVKTYDAYDQYDLRYTDDATELSSVSGIPYQTFDVDLGGRTSGEVAIHYSGSTKVGERVAVKAYNVLKKTWDTLGTFKGTGEVSASLNVASYNDGGVVHVAAMLDYVTNGSNTMIWSTDPQHYTKFEDLHEFYYTIYQYAAEQYVAGNVGYIFTTGDLVDDLPTTSIAPYQWAVADKAMKYVEAVGMPNGLVSGNHDVGTLNATDYTEVEPNADYSRFWETFPASRYENERWYGGSLNNNVSHYDLVTIGNVDFLFLFLGYGVEATDETIVWANDVLKMYPHRTAIVATHEYLDALGATYSNRGKLVYDTIVDPNPNVKMVVCGHDDGSVTRPVTASDGRTVYELLSDYQFVEAEDPDFYANEHWIGKVPSCCGDGYIRLLTVEGDMISNVTYSPVTGRYNPYGDCEVFTLDLDCGTPDRSMATTRFSAAVLGNATSTTDVDRMTVSGGSYSAIVYASVPTAPAMVDSTVWPDTTYGAAATPSNPFMTHAAKEAPTVAFKVDVLEAVNLGAHPEFDGGISNFGGSLGLKIDLNTTPYLYYSFAAPANSKFTFAFINDTTNSPWLTFMDSTLGGSTMNYGAGTWDSYADNGNQYFTTSVTGCVDMRTMVSVSGATDWIVQQLNAYSANRTGVVMSYLFFGSEPLSTLGTSFGPAATPAAPSAAHAAKDAPLVAEKVDVLKAVSLNDNAIIYDWVNYGVGALGLEIDLDKTPYLYYSFSQDAGSKFTFALQNKNDNNPWLTFLDKTKGGATFNNGSANWDSYQGNGNQYFESSMTGCIDMREFLYDDSIREWTVNNVNFYNQNKVPVMVHYLFFGSAAIGGESTDGVALKALRDEAKAMDTTGYTDASVKVLNAAINAAGYVDLTDAAATANAYTALEKAIGALTLVTTTEVDESTLTSLAVYSLDPADWLCAATGDALSDSTSFTTAEAVGSGMRIQRSSAATHTWPSIRYNGDNATYSVKPYGGIYLKLDMHANIAWALQLTVNQYGYTQVVRLNSGIVNSFNNHLGDNYYGTYQNVYDVSEAFEAYGFDASAPFTVEAFNILTVGSNIDWNTYNHIELLTGPETSADYGELQALVNRVANLSSSVYTAATWETFSTALSKAQTALATTGFSQPEVNLEVTRLENAVKALVVANGVEPEGSLLPDDIGAWNVQSGAATATRDGDGDTVVQNTNGSWAYAEHILFNARRVRVEPNQLTMNISLANSANFLLLVDGEWVGISQYITDNRNGDDVNAGDYRVSIPLKEIFPDKDAVVIEGFRVWSVGAVGSNAVYLNRVLIEDYSDFEFDNTLTDYGAAATPGSPFHNHAAKNGPTVAQKVDVLAACGLDHPTFSGSQSYGDNKMHLTVDLNETPYLYYSIVQADDSKCTFGFFNDATYSPWFTFLDANMGGSTMNQSVANWDAITDGSQYFKGSVTGCIDMRAFLVDSTVATWRLNKVTFYVGGASNATISYLYFGSSPLDNGYVEESVLAGDVNFDGGITSVDARMTLMEVLGRTAIFTNAQRQAADFNGDGDRNTTDIRLMLKAAIGAL